MKLIIFDLNRTLFDPDRNGLMAGASDILAFLKGKGCALVLVSRQEPGRSDIVRALDLEPFFAEILFVTEKSEQLFADVMTRHRAAPHETYVVGDYLYQEIRAGNRAGARTIHYRNGMFAGLQPEMAEDVPWRSIGVLSELRDIVV